MVSRSALVAGVCLLAACSGGSRLEVDLRTDFAPGAEFVLVETVITRGDGSGSRLATTDATAGAPFDTGARIASFSGLSRGQWRIRVTLRAPGGRVLAERTTRLQLEGSFGLTVLITRSCQSVSCPGPSDEPAATQCHGGRCVPEDCIPGDPTCGPPVCMDDTGCMSTVPCVEPRCSTGACLGIPRDSRCGAGQRCDAMRGCVDVGADAGPVDGGFDAGFDGGGPDAGPPPADAGTSILVLYVPIETHDGNLGGRAGADAFCAEFMPNPTDFEGCTTPHAFLSVDGADELRDMAANYGYPTDVEIYWYDPRSRSFMSRVADSWSSLFDGFIDTSQVFGVASALGAWSGSTMSGAVGADTCDGWMNGTTGASGSFGEAAAATGRWIQAGMVLCSASSAVRCICQLPQ